MRNNAALELRELISPSDESPEVADVPDPFARFVADSELAAAIGRRGDQAVERFHAETAGLDARITAHYKGLATGARSATDSHALRKASLDDWDEEISDPIKKLLEQQQDDSALAKNHVGYTREQALAESEAEIRAAWRRRA